MSTTPVRGHSSEEKQSDPIDERMSSEIKGTLLGPSEPVYVVRYGQRHRVVRWDPQYVWTEDQKFPSYEVMNVKCRGDGWKYLCPGEVTDVTRYRFLTTVYDDPAKLGYHLNSSSKIRMKWKKWNRKESEKMAWKTITFVPALTEEAGKLPDKIQQELHQPKVSPGRGDTEDDADDWKEERKVEVLDYSDHLIYSKISKDTDLAMFLGAYKVNYDQREILESNINMRLKLFYELSPVKGPQLLRLAQMFDWMFKGLRSTLDLALTSILKVAAFLDQSVTSLVRAFGRSFYQPRGKEETLVNKRLEEIEEQILVEDFRKKCNKAKYVTPSKAKAK